MDSKKGLLKGRLDETIAVIEKAVTTATGALAEADRKINGASNSQLTLPSGALDPLKDTPPVVKSDIDSMESLIEEPAFENTAVELMIKDGLGIKDDDEEEEGAENTDKFGMHAALENKIIEAIQAASNADLNEVVTDVGLIGTIYRVRANYDAILNSTAVKPALKDLKKLIDSGSVDGSYLTKYNAYLSALRLDEDLEVDDVIDASPNIPSDKKAVVKTSTDAIMAVKNRIDDFELTE